jgi:hypothetical protein
LSVGPPPAATAARTALNLGSVDLSFSHALLGPLEGACGGPASGWAFNPSGSLGMSLNVDIHRRFLLLPSGQLSVTLSGELSLQATIPAAAHCDLTVDGPSLFAVVPILGIPVPVEGGVNVTASLSTTSPTGVNASAHLNATAGLDFHDAYATPILNASPSASGSVNGSGGELSVGPQVQVGLGAPAVNGHIAASPQIVYKPSVNGCEIDAAISAGVGLDVFFAHLSVNPIDPQVPIYRCPTPTPPPPPAPSPPPTPPPTPQAPGAGPTLVYDANSATDTAQEGELDRSFTQWSAATGQEADVEETLPSDLGGFRCVMLLVNESLESTAIDELTSYLADGGTLIAVGEHASASYESAGWTTADTTLNELAQTLGVGLSLDEDDLEESGITTNIDPSPLTSGVTSLGYDRVSSITTSGAAEPLASTEGDATFIGAQHVGSGTFILSGDSNAFSDHNEGFYENAGNGQFARDLCP